MNYSCHNLCNAHIGFSPGTSLKKISCCLFLIVRGKRQFYRHWSVLIRKVHNHTVKSRWFCSESQVLIKDCSWELRKHGGVVHVCNIDELLCLSPMWFQVWRLQWGMFLWSTFKHKRWSIWYQFSAGPTLCTQALCYQLQGFQKLSAFEGCKHSLNIGLGSRKMLMQSWSSLVIKFPSSGKKRHLHWQKGQLPHGVELN